MVQKKWEHKFSLRTKNLRIVRGLSNICYRCNMEIEIDSDVYTRNSNSRKSKSKIYHLDCAKEVNIL